MARQSKVSPAMVIIALLTLLIAAQTPSPASANPVNPPLINVDSPQNNKIYPSGEVKLHFTVVPNELIAFTSATYSLDGQPEQTTNGTTTLTGMAAGSHKLTVFGKGTYTTSGQMHEYSSVEAVIYFSVQYSTAWVAFTAVFAAAVSAVSITLWLTRRRIVSAFRGKKTGQFWGGLILFLFFLCVFFVPSMWLVSSDYLFPHYSREIFAVSIGPWEITLAATLVFMCLGLVLMRLGTKGEQSKNAGPQS